jgi:hypothetical protein
MSDGHTPRYAAGMHEPPAEPPALGINRRPAGSRVPARFAPLRTAL